MLLIIKQIIMITLLIALAFNDITLLIVSPNMIKVVSRTSYYRIGRYADLLLYAMAEL